MSFTMFVKKISVFILPGSTHEFLFRISVELIKSLNEVLKILQHVLADEKFLAQLKHNTYSYPRVFTFVCMFRQEETLLQ